MDSVLKFLKDLPANRIVMFAGILFIVAGVARELSNIGIEDQFRGYLVGFGSVLILLSVFMAIYRNHAETKADQRRREDDLKIRLAKMDAGLDPAEDKTVFRP